MKKDLLILQLFCLLVISTLRSQTLVIDSLFYTGSTQTFVIPQCASNLTVMLHGAQGGFDTLRGGYSGGFGGRIYVVMTATPGVPLYVNVGGPGNTYYGGWNGGGNGGRSSWSTGGGGGGSSDIRIGGNAPTDRIFVAGGGGGSGGGSDNDPAFYNPSSGVYGGEGGGGACVSGPYSSFPACPPVYGCGGGNGCSTGQGPGNSGAGACSGGTVSGYGAGGGGGGMNSGGGVSTNTNGCSGTAGTLLQGGAGGDSTCTNVFTVQGRYGGGGGGGGYYGGGGGHSSGVINIGNNNFLPPVNGGGGGGSTYLNNAFVITYSLYGGFVGTAGVPSHITNVNAGLVTFSYTINGSAVGITASQNTVCANTPVTLTASGANSYTWLPVGNFSGGTNSSVSINPTSTTEYTVQGLSSSGCLSQTVITIHVNSTILSIAASPAFSVCSGQALSLSASGATTYSWSGGIQNNVPFTPQASAIYTVFSTGSTGCISSATTGVIVVPYPTLSINPPLPAICPGDSISLSVNGATSYNWSNGQTGSTILVSPPASTTYSVSGSLSGTNMACSSASSIQVVVYPVPVLTVSATQTLICLNETSTVSAWGAITYTWISAGGGSTANLGSMVVSPKTNTTYSVTGTAGNRCLTTGVTNIQVDVCAGITSLSSQSMSLYPNPTKGTFYIESVLNGQITIYSSIGAMVFSKELPGNEKKEFQILSPGLYIVHYQSGNRKVSYKLLVIN